MTSILRYVNGTKEMNRFCPDEKDSPLQNQSALSDLDPHSNTEQEGSQQW